MSETKLPPGKPLSPEQFQEISGGCTLTEIQEALKQLQQSYETLIDFTSHVIERVDGAF